MSDKRGQLTDSKSWFTLKISSELTGRDIFRPDELPLRSGNTSTSANAEGIAWKKLTGFLD